MSERHKRVAYNILRIGFSLYTLGMCTSHVTTYLTMDSAAEGASTTMFAALYHLLTDLLLPGILGILAFLLLLNFQFHSVLNITGYVLAVLCLGLGYSSSGTGLILFLVLFHLLMHSEHHSRRSQRSGGSHRSHRHSHSTSTMRGQSGGMHEPLVSKPERSDAPRQGDVDDNSDDDNDTLA